MSELIDAGTNRTFRHAKLLSTLMDWTTEKRILAAILKARVATEADLAYAAQAIKFTAETRGDVGLQEPHLARLILTFLQNRPLRRVIAAHVQRAYQVSKEQAMRDLVELQQEMARLMDEHGARSQGARPMRVQ